MCCWLLKISTFMRICSLLMVQSVDNCRLLGIFGFARWNWRCLGTVWGGESTTVVCTPFRYLMNVRRNGCPGTRLPSRHIWFWVTCLSGDRVRGTGHSEKPWSCRLLSENDICSRCVLYTLRSLAAFIWLRANLWSEKLCKAWLFSFISRVHRSMVSTSTEEDQGSAFYKWLDGNDKGL